MNNTTVINYFTLKKIIEHGYPFPLEITDKDTVADLEAKVAPMGPNAIGYNGASRIDGKWYNSPSLDGLIMACGIYCEVTLKYTLSAPADNCRYDLYFAGTFSDKGINRSNPYGTGDVIGEAVAQLFLAIPKE